MLNSQEMKNRYLHRLHTYEELGSLRLPRPPVQVPQAPPVKAQPRRPVATLLYRGMARAAAAALPMPAPAHAAAACLALISYYIAVADLIVADVLSFRAAVAAEHAHRVVRDPAVQAELDRPIRVRPKGVQLPAATSSLLHGCDG